MKQLLLILLVGVAYIQADDEPFSIGLGVLSPSYTQRVGKENVKVSFNQKENGHFSYSVGDPNSGTNTFLNFGDSAKGSEPRHIPGRFGSGPARKPEDNPSMIIPAGFSYHATEGQSFLRQGEERKVKDSPRQFLPSDFSYHATEGQAYFRGEQARKPEAEPQKFLPSDFSYHATDGQAYFRGEQARKPNEGSDQIVPSMFSYHATDGQAFLNNGESPNFLIGEEKDESSGRGPAEQSFAQESNGKEVLVDGLVGYGSQESQSAGSLPIGAYAENQGYYKEHGGHN